MIVKHGITTLFSAVLVTASSSAWAQSYQPGAEAGATGDLGVSRAAARAPRAAFEIGLNGGYTQPFGKIANGRVMRDEIGAGGAVGLDLGYRLSPHWSLGFTGQYHDSGARGALDGNTDFRGVAGGVQGTYHMMPYGRVDPYLTLGTGYRLLWRATDRAGDTNLLTHGLELGKAMLGVDFRISPSVALGPVVGADVNLFLWDNPEGPIGNQAIASGDRRPSTFLFAGLAARFDIGGTREDRAPMVASTLTPIGYDTTSMESLTPAAGPPSTPQPLAMPPAATPAPMTPPAATPPPSISMVIVPADILSRCGINETKAFFEFDSADVKTNGTSTLGKLATCVSTGALKGQKLRIIGHADPRGPDQYNQALGRTRAQSVADFLTSHGLNAGSVQTISHGERDATGVNEQGWAFDRRVDIQLMP